MPENWIILFARRYGDSGLETTEEKLLAEKMGA